MYPCATSTVLIPTLDHAPCSLCSSLSPLCAYPCVANAMRACPAPASSAVRGVAAWAAAVWALPLAAAVLGTWLLLRGRWAYRRLEPSPVAFEHSNARRECSVSRCQSRAVVQAAAWAEPTICLARALPSHVPASGRCCSSPRMTVWGPASTRGHRTPTCVQDLQLKHSETAAQIPAAALNPCLLPAVPSSASVCSLALPPCAVMGFLPGRGVRPLTRWLRSPPPCP
jgi:hypothetical protein